MSHIPKQAVLYLHSEKRGTPEYGCGSCMMFIDDKERCTILPKGQVIKAHGSCGLWVGGPNATGETSHGNLTAKQAGYVENKSGFSCKRCVYFRADAQDCFVVDKDSPGDDPGKIHSDGCCNHWEPRK